MRKGTETLGEIIPISVRYKRSLQERRGHCFQCNVETLIHEESYGSWWLCHGIATGTDGEAAGLQYVHAWLESEDYKIAYDAVVRISMPRENYYRLGYIHDVVRYSKIRTLRLIASKGTWGPWRKKFFASNLAYSNSERGSPCV